MRAERKTASTGLNKWVQIATLFLLFQWLEMAFRPVNADPIANSRFKRSHFHMAKAFTKPEIAQTPKPTGNLRFISVNNKAKLFSATFNILIGFELNFRLLKMFELSKKF